MMTRRDDWRPRLHAWINASARRPFAWGEHDCWTFAAGAVEAMTGEDIASDTRGRYKTALGAERVLRGMGHEDVASLAASRLQEVERGSEGDLAAVDDGNGWVAMGVIGRGRIYVLRLSGLGTVEATPLRVFRVG